MLTVRQHRVILPQMLLLITVVLLTPSIIASNVQLNPNPMDRVIGASSYTYDGKQQIRQLAMDSSQTALTMLSTITIDDDRLVEQIWLSGISSREQTPQPKIGLAWVQERSAWFPVWRIWLYTDGSDPIELSMVAPKKGHTYQTLFSYDIVSGASSWRVVDLNDDTLVLIGGCDGIALQDEMGSILAGATLTKSDAQVQVNDLLVFSRYVPVASRVQIYDESIPRTRFDRNEEPTIRLEIPGNTAPGHYFLRFVNLDSGQTHKIGPLSAKSKEIPLSLGEFAPGKTVLEMTYVDQEHMWLSETLNISIGHLNVNYERPKYDYDLGKVVSAARVTADERTEAVPLDLLATVTRLVWDGVTRRYHEEEYPPAVVFAGKPTLERNEFLIPLQINLPENENRSLWRVSFKASSDLSIDVREQQDSYYLTNHLPPNQTSEERPFSIVLLPDTQNYAQDYPHIFMRQTEWIAANAHEKNIRLMLHLGDIVEKHYAHDQWKVAEQSISILDGVVPYVLSVGNHDQDKDRRTPFNRYFPVSRYENLLWFGGVFEEGHHENSYYLFELGGEQILVLSLEFGPRDEVLAWANGIVETYDDHQVIVVTHTYTAYNGKRITPDYSSVSPEVFLNLGHSVNNGEQVWNKLIRKHSNIRMVLSGHIAVPTMRYQVAIGDHKNFVFEMLADYQHEPNGGDGWLVLMEFLDEKLVEVWAYSPYLDQYETNRTEGGYTNHFIVAFEEGMVFQKLGDPK